jgi:hypothetical protein
VTARTGLLLVVVLAAATVAGLSLLVPSGLAENDHAQLAAGDEARWAIERAKAPFQGPIPGMRWDGGQGYVTLYSERRADFVTAVGGDAAAYAQRHPAERMLRLVRIETWRGPTLPPVMQLGAAHPFGGQTGVRRVTKPERQADFYGELVLGALHSESLVLYDPEVDAHYVCPPIVRRCEAVFVAQGYGVAFAFDPEEAPTVRMEVADLRRALPRWLSPKPNL